MRCRAENFAGPGPARTLAAVQPDRRKLVVRVVPRFALSRIALATVLGVAVALLVATWLSWAVALISRWDAGGIVLVGLAWITLYPADAAETGKRAAADAPGRAPGYAAW